MLVLRNNRLNPMMSGRRPINSFFNELFNDDFFNVGQLSRSVPVAGANVYEQDGHLVYELEAPGLRKDDVKVRLEDGVLTISGELRRDDNIKIEQYISVGRRYGAFERRFALPEGAQVATPNKITAKLDHGILTVRLPLAESLQPEAYEIKVD